MQQGPANGQDHADLAGQHSAARRRRRAQPFQRKDKKNAGDEIDDLDDLLIAGEVGHGFVGRLLLNILSMRSVIRNPPTTLLVAATTARKPRMKERLLLCSPTRTIAPTTAMASRALVSDIRGVCNKGETRLITSNPMKPASMNTNNP